MLALPTVEAPNESPTENEGLVRPDATTENDSLVPGITELPGVSDPIESDGADPTVILCTILADSPDELVARMVRLCTPVSLLVGTQ